MGVRRTTISDVAKASGVSTATVSLVLNAVPGQRISPSTRERVTRVARELGYVPHGLARALREGASRIVLLGLPPGIRGGSLDGFVRGLDGELDAHGHVLLVRQAHSPDESLASVAEAVSPRGVIDLTGLYRADGPNTAEETGLGGWVDGLAAHSRIQVRHLADRGHTELAMALPEDPGWARVATARLRFAREAAARLGLPPPRTFGVPGDVPGTAAAMRAFRHAHRSVTAIAAFNDDVALRLLAAARDLGVAVPEDLAVMGFDDTGYGEVAVPALTSVRIDAEAFGRRAARLALGMASDDVVPSEASVVERRSA